MADRLKGADIARSNLMIVVYTEQGHTYTFYDVENIAYHNRHLKFSYRGAMGLTKASFNNIAGMSKHPNIKNPNL